MHKIELKLQSNKVVNRPAKKRLIVSISAPHKRSNTMFKLTLNAIRDTLNGTIDHRANGDLTELSIACITSKVKGKLEKEVMKNLMSGDMDIVKRLTTALKHYNDMSISDSKGHIIDHLETLEPDTVLNVKVDKNSFENFPIADVIGFLKTSPVCDSDKVKISDLFVQNLLNDGIDTTYEVAVMPKKAVVKNLATFSMVRDTVLSFNTLPENERHGNKAKSYENENYQLFWNSELLLKLEGYTITREKGKLRAVRFKK